LVKYTKIVLAFYSTLQTMGFLLWTNPFFWCVSAFFKLKLSSNKS